MTMHMMFGNRELRGVPLDFDWPLEKVWSGYRLPDELRLPDCQACGASGFSPTARWLYATRWSHKVNDPAGCWWGQLVQADLDYLIEQEYLWTRIPGKTGKESVHTLKHGEVTLEELNAQLRDRRSELHGGRIIGVSDYALIKRRCAALGAAVECSVCDGKADIGTPEQRQAMEDWKPTEPPTGDGLQVWETTSEGSPITPVFPNTEEGQQALIQYLLDNQRGGVTWTRESATKFVSTREDFCVDLFTGEVVNAG